MTRTTTARRLTFVPVFKRVGRQRRLFKFFYIPKHQTEGDEARYSRPGWYFICLFPDPAWLVNAEQGPYASLDSAISDLTEAEEKNPCNPRPDFIEQWRGEGKLKMLSPAFRARIHRAHRLRGRKPPKT
jgi:hypothetical protein